MIWALTLGHKIQNCWQDYTYTTLLERSAALGNLKEWSHYFSGRQGLLAPPVPRGIRHHSQWLLLSISLMELVFKLPKLLENPVPSFLK